MAIVLSWEHGPEQVFRHWLIFNDDIAARVFLGSASKKLTTFHVKFEDDIDVPLQQIDASEFRPILDGRKAQRVGAVTIPGALAIQFPEPVPDLPSGRWD